MAAGILGLALTGLIIEQAGTTTLFIGGNKFNWYVLQF